MTPLHAQELRRDFVRSRQSYVLGWPDSPDYSAEDCAYIEMLEAERIAGRIQIDGTILEMSEVNRLICALS
jgi:hypothetical protein